jgi:cellulose synthase/poly-beta-1,6-N-acetylglucosamine synthase-like glycosyltransferase
MTIVSMTLGLIICLRSGKGCGRHSVTLGEYDAFGEFGESSRPFFGLFAPDREALPRLGREALCDALRRLPPDELETALRLKLVPIVTLPGLTLFVACGTPALAEAGRRRLKVIAYSEARDFIAAARAVHGDFLLAEATSRLARRQPEASAARRLTSDQAGWAILIVSGLSGAAALLPFDIMWMAISTLSGLFFLSVLALKVLCLMPEPGATAIRAKPIADGELPVYSVLVPLFRETSVLKQLLGALKRIDYPEDKLDIKLILEEEDVLMQRALTALRLPAHFEVIVVPAGRPQTKPRALNYALQFSRGELLTIYDAEDVPEADQLRKAAEAFAVSPPEVACLQAQLTFYNPDENWLTRNFTIEYASLFGVLLPVLSSHRLPLLLGGTSNHFRTAILRQVGAWDPHNVTEDADLGLRLARSGFDTATLDSRTAEEANMRLVNWIRQRARWLKGFLATWLVHMRNPGRFMAEVGPAGFWVAQAMTLGVVASCLLHPFCIAGTAVLYALYPPALQDSGWPLAAVAGLNVFILVAGYALSIAVAGRALRRCGIKGRLGTFASMPLYWMLMSAAAWCALWQFLASPFHWNKTEHGLTRMRLRFRQP